MTFASIYVWNRKTKRLATVARCLDLSKRSRVWTASDSEPATTAFDTQGERDMIIDPLVDKMFGTTLGNQPNQTDIRPVLNTLIDQLTTGCTATSCPATFTRNAVKGVCSAVLSSAAVQIH